MRAVTSGTVLFVSEVTSQEPKVCAASLCSPAPAFALLARFSAVPPLPRESLASRRPSRERLRQPCGSPPARPSLVVGLTRVTGLPEALLGGTADYKAELEAVLVSCEAGWMPWLTTQSECLETVLGLRIPRMKVGGTSDGSRDGHRMKTASMGASRSWLRRVRASKWKLLSRMRWPATPPARISRLHPGAYGQRHGGRLWPAACFSPVIYREIQERQRRGSRLRTLPMPQCITTSGGVGGGAV